MQVLQAWRTGRQTRKTNGHANSTAVRPRRGTGQAINALMTSSPHAHTYTDPPPATPTEGDGVLRITARGTQDCTKVASTLHQQPSGPGESRHVVLACTLQVSCTSCECRDSPRCPIVQGQLGCLWLVATAGYRAGADRASSHNLHWQITQTPTACEPPTM